MTDKDYNGLFTTVINENNSLKKSIQYLKDVYTNYENDQIQWFNNVNNFLYCIYYLIVVLFAVILVTKNKKYPFKTKIIMKIPLIIFPFFISFIELRVYNVMRYVWSFIMIRSYPGNALE